MDIDGLLKKKIAGVPVPVIGGVVAAGVAYYAYTIHTAPSDVTDVPEGDAASADPTAEGDPGNAALGQPTFYASNPGAVYGTGSTVTATTTQDTDDAWKRRAVEWLIANGTDASLASNAMSKYLNGAQLTFEEGAARDKVLAQFGLPPESIPTGKTNLYKGPASKQGEPPVSHIVKGTSDDSFSELALLYYGLGGGIASNLIEAANGGAIKEPFPVGTTIRIPKYHDPKYFVATSHTRSLYDIAKRNGTTAARIHELNGEREFPVKVGTRVRVA